ncbi:hypothetical protein ACFQ1S_14530 [Kibdelosporangium lantanae]|uniref:Uncharacterized protein n=1 Tax=Kibdelosporangium lantanae TaxID=1497396 RepID=A0ABW3M7I4_9PSEU
MGRATNSKVAKQAKQCGMTVDQWQAARNQVNSGKGRGRVQHVRPESTMWDPVEGQTALFGDD